MQPPGAVHPEPPVITASDPEAHKLASFPLLDWLRFALASIVLLSHSNVRFFGPIDGGLAVSVFFALSGWLIGGILLRSDRSDLPRFFYDRSTRIWIPYFVAIMLLYATATVRGIDGNWFKYLFYDATFTHYTFTVFPRALTEMPLAGTGNHFWSISVEEQFYLVAPLLILFTRWGKSIAVWIVLAALLMAAQSVFAPIAAGVCAAAFDRRYAIVSTPARRRIAAGAALLAFGLAWIHDVEPFRALFSTTLVLALTIPGHRDKLGRIAGGVSYPLYLNQWIGGFAVHGFAKRIVALPFAVGVSTTYIASLGVSLGAWYVIDRRVMLARNGWYTVQRGQFLRVTGYAIVGTGLVGGLILRSTGR